MASRYLFSTGILYYRTDTPASVDDLFTEGSAIALAALQDINVETGYQKRDLFGPANESLFPIATAHYNGSLQFTAALASFDPDALVEMVGLTQTLDGTVITDRATKVFTIPTLVSLFKGEDSNGNAIRLAVPKTRFQGKVLRFQRDNWMQQNLVGEGYPDADGAVGYLRFDD